MSYKHTGMLLFGWQDLPVTAVISCCADQQLNKCTQGRGIVHKSEECFPELCFVEVHRPSFLPGQKLGKYGGNASSSSHP